MTQDIQLPTTEISTGLPPHNKFIFSRTFLHAMSTLAYCAFEMVGEISKNKRQKIHNYLLSNHVSTGIDANGLGFVELAIPHFGILNQILQTFI